MGIIDADQETAMALAPRNPNIFGQNTFSCFLARLYKYTRRAVVLPAGVGIGRGGGFKGGGVSKMLKFLR